MATTSYTYPDELLDAITAFRSTELANLIKVARNIRNVDDILRDIDVIPEDISPILQGIFAEVATLHTEYQSTVSSLVTDFAGSVSCSTSVQIF